MKNLLNNAFPKNHAPNDNGDGVALACMEHPDDFPWHFVHKLVNVSKRKPTKDSDT